ncbi:serine hydrolase domain-containing protein [Bosea psychrotolerans]|uniref:CubicO group peptidase (Beta-lactamase class C family) n=1 Tax=Bosea psychrotolerans TaxID=1871628 RepID=A0A2S4M863_9HYPH|nr:serine hydrolase [Bosea psychrotolerans]POR50922.1 CubicO group peptidase (beta-lactamase class C family) [Bosea psychrotolerans]
MTISTESYVPPSDGDAWDSLSPAQAGFDAVGLAAAVDFARAHESSWPRSLYYPDGRYVGLVEWNESGPWSEIVGPVRERGGPAGLIVKGGRIVAEWGDTARTDMTFSIAKSYIAILAGLAVADGLIGDVDEPVVKTVAGPWFESAHNRAISWRHLLQQSSEWQGEIFGKSDQVDHNRQIGPGADNSRKGEKRALQPPGSYYEYNDVRVNLLAYCLLQRFRRPLPEVLRERIMDPIGASQDWRWQGYDNAFVEIDERRVQSVPGGGHWGGGLFIGARDHARVGLLVARGGVWGGRELLSPAWIEAMLTPSPTLANYGYLWWLNRGATARPNVSETAVFALGAGVNAIWLDPAQDLVAVLRWIDKTALDGFVDRLIAAIR